MQAYDIFKEYIWLIQTIHRYRKITLEELDDLYRETRMGDGRSLPRTTFNRHRESIKYVFGITIGCDRRDGYRYYIENSNVLEEDSVQNWLFSTLSVNNIISESLSLQDRIQIESIPADTFLADIMDAMKKGRKIEMKYRRFGAEPKTHILCPYALKVYQKRWYLLAYFEARVDSDGKEHKAHYAIFALDRIEGVTVLREKFKMPKDFMVKDYFSECYGIVSGDETKAERVVIRAYGREAYDMRTLPLHHSQREIERVKNVENVENVGSYDKLRNQDVDYADFELYLKPTLDFIGKLLSRGAWVEVLQPQWLREKIADQHKQSFERYNV